MYLRNALAVILQVPPTYTQSKLTFNIDDYGKKQSITLGRGPLVSLGPAFHIFEGLILIFPY
jgi:hypothetical protein